MYGQDTCHFAFKGRIVDAKDNSAIPGTSVTIKEQGKTVPTDSLGRFSFSNICKGKYTIICQSIGYEKNVSVVTISKNSREVIALKEIEDTVGSVEITAHTNKATVTTVASETLQGQAVDQTRGESLGESLKSITGLNSFQTGAGVSKPVIHGLHSNRILILNNGVAQEGQQWGTDHAPEVDPFIASEITVVKGAESIRYGSDAIGGVISLEPKKMPDNPGLNGEINLMGATNNRMGVAEGMLEGAFGKKLTGLSWRIQGTLKRAGNSEAPGYYLFNTGIKESDYSAELSYQHKNFRADVYFSQYATTIGILVASVVGNIDDLNMAINSPKPNEPDFFSYNVQSPYSYVNHTLLKTSGWWDFGKSGKITGIYAQQEDLREEFEKDASNATNDSLSDYYNIFTYSGELNWQVHYLKFLSTEAGISGSTQGNITNTVDQYNVIPNFLNYGGGIYGLEKYENGPWTIEGGMRYDYLFMQAFLLNVNQKEIEPVRQYSHTSGTLGATYAFNNKLSWNINYANAWRPPEPNELFGNGVHLSAASFETGDSNLQTERANNFSSSARYDSKRFVIEAGVYYNIINNFIFLEPSATPKVTPSGTYPAFDFTQANVVYKGLDLDFTWNITKNLSFVSKTTIVRAFNYTINNYLIYTPADRFDNGLKYQWAKLGRLNKPYLNFSNLFVAHQDRVPPNSDYAPPPPAYTLFNVCAGFYFSIAGRETELNLSVLNIANTPYRDYLDRLRYFSYEPGRNIMLRLKIPMFKTNNE